MKQFSAKQKTAMTWWANPRYQEYDAIICDGAVRSGKTLSMGMGFFLWAMSCFTGRRFALCGKTRGGVRRNVVQELLPWLRRLGITVSENRTAQVLRVLHDHGITVALDDFGTGNAALELLHDLPLQWVKLDRALVKNLTTDNVNQAMVTSLTDLAHRLKIHVCVKGIETEAQRQYATRAGADFLQGFLFSRPVTAQEFERQFLQK